MDDTWRGFLGRWELIEGSCVYEQGEPPLHASYVIREQDGELAFEMRWLDATGERHETSFSARPDGARVPLPDGQLADALATVIVSDGELTTTAYRDGNPLMVARRTLSDSRKQMSVSQSVRLPDGSMPTNWSTYRRVTG